MMVEAMLIFSEMRVQGVCPDVCTYSTVIASLCRMGGLAAAMGKLDETNAMGVKLYCNCLSLPNSGVLYPW
jgi:hypothetical protein